MLKVPCSIYIYALKNIIMQFPIISSKTMIPLDFHIHCDTVAVEFKLRVNP